MEQPNIIEKYPRPAGLALLIAGGYLLYNGFISPMLQVKANAHEVSFSSGKQFFISLVCISVALPLIIFGGNFMQYMAKKAKYGSTPTYVLVVVVMLGIYGLHVLFNRYLNSIGYH